MAKLTLTDPTAGYNSSTVIADNNALVEAAIENTLSRDGTSPNAMAAAIDMNSNKINNLADGTSNQDAVTVSQLNTAVLGGPVVTASLVDAESSTDGYVLTSDGAGNAAWETSSAAAGSVPASAIDAEASADGYVLTSDGVGNAAWEATGTGDITKVGTPANNQMAVWTGDGTLEGDSAVTTTGGTVSAQGFNLGDDESLTLGAGNDGQFLYQNSSDEVILSVTNATDFSISMGTGYINLDTAFKSGSAYLNEQAAAKDDIAAYGQVWVKNTTPNQLWFTDDTGVDTRLGLGASGGDAWGDVVDAVITPDADGTRDLAATATRFATAYVDDLDVTNNIVVGGTVDGRDLATDGAKLDGIGTISAFGATIIDDADAAAVLTTLGVDTDVATLALPASTTISAFGATVIDDANAAAVLTTLGVDTDIATLSLPASTTISTFGASLIDDADAATARTTLGIDAIPPAHGEMTISGGSTATTVSVADTYYQVVADWVTGDVEDVTFATNELIVGTTGLYMVMCSFSFTGATNDTFTFALSLNDVAVASTAIQHKTATTDVSAASVQGIMSLTAADAVQLLGKNNADTDDFTVTDANYSLFRIG